MALTQTERDTELVIQAGCITMVIAYPLLLLLKVTSTGHPSLSEPSTLILLMASLATWIIALKISWTKRCEGCSCRITKATRICKKCLTYQDSRFQNSTLAAKGKKSDKFISLPERVIQGLVIPKQPKLSKGTIWLEGTNTRTDCELVKIGFEGDILLLRINQSEKLKSFKEVWENSDSKQALFRMFLPSGNYFFKVKYSGLEKDEFILFISGEFFKLERRIHARFPVSLDENVRLGLRLDPKSKGKSDPNNEKIKNLIIENTAPVLSPVRKNLIGRVFDISQGGIGFILNEEESKKLSVGDHIQVASIQLKGRTVEFGGQIRYKRDSPIKMNGRTVKMGICFEKIATLEHNYIMRYVLEQKRRYSMRYD